MKSLGILGRAVYCLQSGEKILPTAPVKVTTVIQHGRVLEQTAGAFKFHRGFSGIRIGRQSFRSDQGSHLAEYQVIHVVVVGKLESEGCLSRRGDQRKDSLSLLASLSAVDVARKGRGKNVKHEQGRVSGKEEAATNFGKRERLGRGTGGGRGAGWRRSALPGGGANAGGGFQNPRFAKLLNRKDDVSVKIRKR